MQKIRTALKRFAKYGFLTDELTNQNRLITIVKWDVYQHDDRSGASDVTDSQQMSNRQLTPNKNVKNEKKEIIKYPKAIYDERSEYHQLALALLQNICSNHSDQCEPNLEKWTNEMKRIVENDQRTIEQIQHLITGSQQHRGGIGIRWWRKLGRSTMCARGMFIICRIGERLNLCVGFDERGSIGFLVHL